MGYEGHLQMVNDRSEAKERVAEAMALLRAAHDDVGGDIVSTGGTGTHDLHVIGLDHPTGVTDVQAGSYVMVDTQYQRSTKDLSSTHHRRDGDCTSRLAICHRCWSQGTRNGPWRPEHRWLQDLVLFR